MVSAGSYLLSAVALAALVLSLGLQRLPPAPARSCRHGPAPPPAWSRRSLGVALLIWLSELLGHLRASSTPGPSSLQPALGWGGLRLGSTLAAVGPPVGGVGGARSRTPPPAAHPSPGDRTRGPELAACADRSWCRRRRRGHRPLGPDTKHALDRGIFNFDSLWYHMPFAADIAQSHSVTGIHHAETVFTNWFYPQNSELLHAVGILLVQRDTLSLFLNFGWLAVAFLAAWCVGRPYGRGHLSVSRRRSCSSATRWSCASPGRRRTTWSAAALVLAAIAILINAWAGPRRDRAAEAASPSLPSAGRWRLAGLAVGLAVGTKLTVLAMAGGAERRGDRAGARGTAPGRGRVVVPARRLPAAASGTCAT